MPLLTPESLQARRREIHAVGELSCLRDRLEGQLRPLRDRPLFVPERKPVLTQDGGVCPQDASRLEFDPLAPTRHRCPRCGETYEGERHDWAWIWRYHLWLSERAIHLALLAAVDDKPSLATGAEGILEAYGRLYFTLPNRDNVLGPTRLFFSTYLESIWLTQVVMAASLLAAGSGREPGADLAPMVRASAELIGSFDEGWSNRQVWNNVALASAGVWLADGELVDRALDGPHGLKRQLLQGVADDGLWFEGENYHFFALRGFLLGAEAVRAAGVDLYGDPDVGRRLRSMYLGPLDTVLPDLTLPARGDSPFGVSLCQERFAELWEVARARFEEARIDRLLTSLYAAAVPEGEDWGFREIAEQELNRDPHRVRRDRLGWKGLLWMRPDPPTDIGVWQGESRCLAEAGIVVLRPDDGRYLSLESGGHPGGHGHPDLLHVTLYDHGLCLGDPGTGSYVDATLAWYRSSRAHNAPAPAGRDQVVRRGWCSAFEAKEGWSWCRAVAEDVLGTGTRATRTLVSGPAFAVDVVDVDVATDVLVDLPVHPLGGLPCAAPPGEPVESEGLPRRFPLLEDGSAEIVLVDRTGEALLAGTAPGPPTLQLAAGAPLSYLVRRAAGPGRWVQLYVHRGARVRSVADDGQRLRIRMADDATVEIRLGADVASIQDPARGTLELRGARRRPSFEPSPAAEVLQRIRCPVLRDVPHPATWRAAVPASAVYRLGHDHYRRSESDGPGEFAAAVAVFVVGSSLCFAVDVSKSELSIRHRDAPNPRWDNEHPDIHSDGIQCYLDVGGWSGYVAVPDARSDGMRTRSVPGTAGRASRARGTWCRTPAGYAAIVVVAVGHALRPGDTLRVNLVVNEMYDWRQRRAGQLALSAGGGWVYLRGDREDWHRAAIAEVM